MRFTLWIVRIEGDNHWQGLFDAARGIQYSLVELGHEAELVTNNPGTTDRQLIVFNAHRLPAGWKFPDDTIIFNAEQIPVDSWLDHQLWRDLRYARLLRRHIVWDYSETNIERLRVLDVNRAVHCRIGYWPGLETVKPAEEKLDVFHIGSLNARRHTVLDEITRRGLLVRGVFGSYGEERDRWIAQAKVVLNVHYYPEPIFEIFRVSQLLANKKCVVSEDGGRDPELETLAKATTVYVPFGKIPETCEMLVKDERRRREVAENGYRIFSEMKQVEYVKMVLDVSI